MNIIFIAKEGGLFDFDLTLPLVILEFLVLNLFLQRFLFNPILTTIENRREFINEISGEINFISSQTSQLISRYETLLNATRVNLRVNSLEFNQQCESIFSTEIRQIGERNQKFLKVFESAILKSIPIRAKKISKYSFETEETLMEKALLSRSSKI